MSTDEALCCCMVWICLSLYCVTFHSDSKIACTVVLIMHRTWIASTLDKTTYLSWLRRLVSEQKSINSNPLLGGRWATDTATVLDRASVGLCCEKQVGGKHVYKGLQPQPPVEKIIRMRWYYATLAVNPYYRRHITSLVTHYQASSITSQL